MRFLLILFIIFNIRLSYADIEDIKENILNITYAPFAFTWFTSVISSAYTYNRPKLILIKCEANAYVASNGEIHSIYLEKTLIALRKKYPNTSDIELAKAIIAY